MHTKRQHTRDTLHETGRRSPCMLDRLRLSFTRLPPLHAPLSLCSVCRRRAGVRTRMCTQRTGDGRRSIQWHPRQSHAQQQQQQQQAADS